MLMKIWISKGLKRAAKMFEFCSKVTFFTTRFHFRPCIETQNRSTNEVIKLKMHVFLMIGYDIKS